jgi:hypothetical protein
MVMTGREDEDEPYPPPPSREDVAKFEAGEADSGPSIENFIVDLAAGVSSPWNKKIISIYVKHFIQDSSNECTAENKDVIKKKITGHIKYLIKLFRNELKAAAGSDDWEKRLAIAASNRRRLQVSFCPSLT